MAPDRTNGIIPPTSTSEPYSLENLPSTSYHNNASSSTSAPATAGPSTSTSTSTSIGASRKPLNTLSRNQACRTCRSRKVKCDAVKPACKACRKTATAQGRNPDDVICEYDTDETITKKTSRKSSGEANSNHGGTNNNNGKSGGNASSSGNFARPSLPDPTTSFEETLHSIQQGDTSLNQDLRQTIPPGPGLTGFQGMDWVGVATSGLGPHATYSTFNHIGQGMPMQNNGSMFTADSNGSGSTGDSLYGLPAPRPFEMPKPAWGTNGYPSTTTTTMQSPPFGGGESGSTGSRQNTTPQNGQVQTSTSAPGSTTGQIPYNSLPPAAMQMNSGNGHLGGQDSTHISTQQQLQSQQYQLLPQQQQQQQQQTQQQMPTAQQYMSQAVGSNSISDGDFFNLFWPNWPPSLPSPKLVYSLCDIFFSRKWLAEGIVNKDKFFRGLACPPTHASFPHISLIHAICAVATKFVAPDAFGVDKESYWRSEPTPTDFHAAAAKIHIDSAIIRGEKLLCVAQAIILVCFYSYTSARFVEVWLYCGLATRISSPLGLNHIESLIDERQVFGTTLEHANSFRKGPSPAACVPTSEEEKQEQAHTFWLAFTCDRLAAACTGWASSMPEDEISTLLPKPSITPGAIQPITDAELEQLSLSSPTFFTSNTLPLVNACNLQYKSVVLLGRVCSFLRSAPWPLGADIIRGARSYRSGHKQIIADIPHSAEFKKLDALIVAFRLSFPKEYKNVLKRDELGAVEVALVSAHVIPHAATILLHEAFCEQEEDVSMQRCLTSARAILSIIYLLWEISYDISMLQPFVTFCWAVAGRTLVRQLAFKREAQDELGEATLKQEVSVILSAMRMFSERNALGVVVTKALQSLLDDPDLCHPRQNGGQSMSSYCDISPTTTGVTPASANGLAAPDSGTVSTSNPPSATVETPGTMFSNLLWELEQPGVQISENEKFKKMEFDLRSLIGPSYDQLLSMSSSDFSTLSSTGTVT